jgi:hypothetical protein
MNLPDNAPTSRRPQPQLRTAYEYLLAFGWDVRKTLLALRGLPSYVRDFRAFRKQSRSAAATFASGKLYPCLDDRYEQSGSARGHYFHQDLLVARRISANRPARHVDVGSRIDGFVAHVASFRPIEVLDVRPLSSSIPNITFMQADLMAPLPESMTGFCDSLSCLHALEHFGLGRYGDRVDHDGYLRGLDNLHRMLAGGGKLYLSVPIGPQRIEFNAHRVFSVAYVLQCVSGKYRIDQFSFVDDDGDLHENVALTEAGAATSFGCDYGCGIFEMSKL